ncbi:MAG: AraC family transcriptional regulator [Pseudoramibacter sp.]
MQITHIPLDDANRETTKQGTSDFPIAVYYSTLSKNILGYTPLHWHEEIQYCLITRGCVNFYVNEENFRLAAGDGIFINSGYLHMAKPVNDPHSTYICLDINPRLLAGFPGSVMEQRYVLPFLENPALSYFPLNSKADAGMLDAIHDVYTLSEAKPQGYELEILARLYHLFYQTLKHPKKAAPSQPRRKKNALVQKMLSYMSAHYSEKIQLSDIAAAASYSESACCRIFKRFTGESLMAYLKAFRLEQSTHLLVRGTLSVSDVAYACGFSSTSYFIRLFRDQFGMTPLKYQQHHCASVP